MYSETDEQKFTAVLFVIAEKLEMIDLSTGALERDKDFGDVETSFSLPFSSLDIPVSTQKVTISLGRNCADLGFSQRVWYFCLAAQPAETLLK